MYIGKRIKKLFNSHDWYIISRLKKSTTYKITYKIYVHTIYFTGLQSGLKHYLFYLWCVYGNFGKILALFAEKRRDEVVWNRQLGAFQGYTRARTGSFELSFTIESASPRTLGAHLSVPSERSPCTHLQPSYIWHPQHCLFWQVAAFSSENTRVSSGTWEA